MSGGSAENDCEVLFKGSPQECGQLLLRQVEKDFPGLLRGNCLSLGERGWFSDKAVQMNLPRSCVHSEAPLVTVFEAGEVEEHCVAGWILVEEIAA